MPYVYAPWMKFAGVNWISAKLVSALLTALLGTLLYEHVRQQTRNWLPGLSAVVLFASSTFIFAWFPQEHRWDQTGQSALYWHFIYCTNSVRTTPHT